MKIKSCLKKNWAIWFVVFVIFAYVSFILFRGENVYIQVHDNLDSNVANYQVLSDNEAFFSNGTLPVLGGLDRDYFASEFKVNTLLYALFPTYYAYIISQILKVILSVIGWYLLCRELFVLNVFQKNLAMICGFIYGILPTFPTACFRFATLPLLLVLCIRIYKRPTVIKWLLLFIYPVFSSFATSGIFICGYLVLFFLIDSIRQRRISWRVVGMFAVFTAGLVLIEYRLFSCMLWSAEESIRSDKLNMGFKDSLEYAIELMKDRQLIIQAKNAFKEAFLYGQYHSGDAHHYLVLPVCVGYAIYLNVKYLIEKKYRMIFRDIFNIFFAWTVFNAFVYGLEYWPPFKLILTTFIPQLSGFSIARTLWFSPFTWYFCFSIILLRIAEKNTVAVKTVTAGLCLVAIVDVIYFPDKYNDIRSNIVNIKQEACGEYVSDLTYREFYSKELFDTIKNDIGYSGEWSVAVGFHPSVLYYNAISTLDGYNSYYPAEYKQKFRKIIEPALEIDPSNKSYFDDWGGRAYIFTPGLSYSPIRDLGQDTAELVINEKAFRDLNGKYIFSRVRLENKAEYNMEELGCYTAESSPYTVYVYRMNE